MRIGTGFDAHRFADPAPGAEVVIGGVAIPFERGILAHSDGDVVIHALCDAILGACALGDIGMHFPDTDAALAGADSRVLLRQCYDKAIAMGLALGNADITLIAERPKVRPYVDTMRKVLADTLGVDVGCISIKATTTEGMGFAGREEGIAAQAVVLLQ